MNLPPRLSLGSYRNSLIWRCAFWTGLTLGTIDALYWLPKEDRKWLWEAARRRAREARMYREELTDG